MNGGIENMPAVNQRIRNLIDMSYKGSVRAFCVALGFTDSQKVNRLFKTDPRNGKYPTPSIDILNLISNSLDISLTWLQNGEGEMLKGQVDETEEEANPNTSDMTINRLLDALERRDQQVAEAMAQNSRLINVIERMQGISLDIGASTPPHLQTPKSTL